MNTFVVFSCHLRMKSKMSEVWTQLHPPIQATIKKVHSFIQMCPPHNNLQAALALLLSDLDEHLARVVALEQAHEGLGRVLDSVDNRLAALELALPDPVRHVFDRLAVLLGIVKHNEALHARTLRDQRAVVSYNIDTN
jgi:hypothetical protein